MNVLLEGIGLFLEILQRYLLIYAHYMEIIQLISKYLLNTFHVGCMVVS